MITIRRTMHVATDDADDHAELSLTATHRCADNPDPEFDCTVAACDVVLSQVIIRALTHDEPLSVSAVSIPMTMINALVAALVSVAATDET